MTGAGAVTCGDNSRYRLPTIPIDDLPTPIAIALADEIGSVEVSGVDWLRLLEPLPVADDDKSRFYLDSVFWQTVDDELVAASTNGRELLRVAIKAGPFSTDRHCIVPTAAAVILRKLARLTKPAMMTLRRSKTLLSVGCPEFELTTTLVASTFPFYEECIPPASENVATCDRSGLTSALSRLAAAATVDTPLLALSWSTGGPLELYLAREPASGSDALVTADTRGAARVAVSLRQLREMLEELKGERIEIDAAGPLVLRAERRPCEAGARRHLLLEF
jgi:DNA polymerase III sliding clamp (beta) subunit (PCNA family)